MSWKGQERREYPRAMFSCKIIVKSPHRELVSHTENIGEGGIRVNLEEELKHSAIVDLEFFLKQNKPIRCEGRIIWVVKKVSPNLRKPTMFYTGIKFRGMNIEDKKCIKQLVDEILRSKGNH